MSRYPKMLAVLVFACPALVALGQTTASAPSTAAAPVATTPATTQAGVELPEGAVAVIGPTGADGQPIGRINAVAIRPDGKALATAGADGCLRLWKLPSGKELQVLKPPPGTLAKPPAAAASQPATTQAAAPSEPKGLLSVAYSPDGNLVAAAYGGGVICWDAAGGKHPFTIQAPSPRRVEFVNLGKEIRTLGGKDERLYWSLADRRVVRKEPQPAFTIPNIFMGPDTTLHVQDVVEDPFGDVLGALWMLSGKNIYRPGLIFSMVDAKSKMMINELAVQMTAKTPGGVAAFSWPNGRYLAAGGTNDGVLAVFDVAMSTPQKALKGHKGMITSVAFTRDGKFLASSDTGGVAIVWSMGLMPKIARGTDLGKAWEQLAVADPRINFGLVWQFVDAQDRAVRFIQDKLNPEIKVDQAEFKKILEELDSDTYAVRVKARARLTEVAPGIWPAIRDAIKDAGSTEVRDALEAVLVKVSPPTAAQENLAVMALERMGSEEAVKLLRTFASSPGSANLSAAAKRSLDRLESLGLLPLASATSRPK